MRLHVDVVSDVVCPWCFIGKRRLEKALRALGPEVERQVVWHPFELNPEMPPEGMDRRAYRQAKFGSLEASRLLDGRLVDAGAAEGVAFAFDRITRTPNTFDAHRLIWLAGRKGRQDAVVEVLFRRYFVDGADIGCRDTLVEVAAACGVGADDAERVLESREGAEEVRRAEAEAWRLGIHGVPHFVLNGRSGISGAQSPAVLAAAFQQVLDGTRGSMPGLQPSTREAEGGAR